MNTDDILRSIREYADTVDRNITFMEVCGTHTMSAFQTGLRSLLPSNLSLVSGPGCPVCVTVDRYIDLATGLAEQPDTVITTFGDMLRVPGTERSLQDARARGSDIRVVYAPSDALNLAEQLPDKRVIFLGVGFETTTPSVAWTIKQADQRGIKNFYVLGAHKRVPPAMEALVADGDIGLDGFMCPGHVSVITGSQAYRRISEQFSIPCVVTGFEGHDMAEGVLYLLRQVADGRAQTENQYSRAVTEDGNAKARAVIDDVFYVDEAEWRGLGCMPNSGLSIRSAFAHHDARKFESDIQLPEPRRNSECLCGDILRGKARPSDCTLFGAACTPLSPVGPCMVSSEGTCAAHYQFGGQSPTEWQNSLG